MSMLWTQTPRLIRANHRWDDPTRLVEHLRPKQQPRRVRDPQLVTKQDRLRGIKRTRCAPRYHFNPLVCDSDIRPQSHKGAGGQHNPTAPALSSSKSSALFAPRITESPSTATIPHSDDRATDRETHRVTKRTGLEGQLSYSNSSKSSNGSVAEPHELRAGANSASNPSQQPTTWGRPDPTSRPFAPQTTASESSRPAAGDDAGQVVRYLTDAVCAPHYYFNPRICVSDIRPQPWRGTGGPYSSVAASSSKSSLSRITQLGDATLESSLPAPVSGQHRAETNSHAPKKTPKSSKQRVVNVGFLAEPSLGERATQDRVGQLRKTNSNISESWQNSDLLSPAQTAAGQQDSLSPPAKDPPGAKTAYQVRVDPPRGANSSISESQNVDPASGAQTLAVQPVRTPPELPVYPNESRVSAPTDEKGYHGTPSNKREAPNSVSSQLPVYRDDSLVSAPTDEKGYHGAPSPWREAPNNVSSTHVRHQQNLLPDAFHHPNYLSRPLILTAYPTGRRTPPPYSSEGCLEFTH